MTVTKTIVVLLYATIYIKLITDVVAPIDCNDIENFGGRKHLNHSTIKSNCTKPCKNLDGNYIYDDYHMFQFRLNRYQWENFNSTLGNLTETTKKAKFWILRDLNGTRKFQLWWKCFRKHNAHIKNKLNFVTKHRFNDWLGFTIRNPTDLYEIYDMEISNKTGHVFVLQPSMYQDKKVNYLDIYNFILEKFNLKKEELDKNADLYSLTNIHVCKNHNSMAYNTILTMYQNPNISKKLKSINAKSQDYNDNTTDENIYNYYSYDPFNITKPESQSNTQNYSYNSIDIIKVEAQGKTQRVIDILSTVFIITFICLLIAFFYLYYT
jgi:hypothetical protein